jgi:uncharacterized protein YcfJ
MIEEYVMSNNLRTICVLISGLAVTACATVPNGPSTMALPGTGKSFEQFRADDAECRQFALDQIGGKTANQASDESFVKSAAVGTALGAAIGAIAGGGRGAGTGAAVGVAAGSMIGINEANVSSAGTQRRYDNAYNQCMYAKGEQVPVAGRVMNQRPTYAPPPPPAPSSYSPPPPPPGYAPPPPPDVSR